MKSKLQLRLRENWRNILYLLSVIVLFCALYGTRLGGFMPGNSLFENPNYLGVNLTSRVLEDISFGPLKASQLVMTKINDMNTTLLRLLSVGVVAITLFVFYNLISKWHTRRIAVLTTFMFATSTYVLQLGRSANHEVLFLSIFPLLLIVGTWLKSKKHVRRLPLASTIVAMLLYIPGMYLFLVALGAIFYKRLLLAWRVVGRQSKIISCLLFVFLLIPLIYSFIVHPTQIIEWLGLNSLDKFLMPALLSNLKDIPWQLFVNGPDDPSKWLVGSPIIDIFTTAMLIIGINAYRRGRHPLRARILLGFFIGSILLISLGGYITVALLLPLIYIVVANGITNMLQYWFTVFPRNPFARNVGVFLLSIVILFAAGYHTKRYFIAWPNAPATKQAFQAPLEQ